MYIQYEVWGSLNGHEELVECVGSRKEADQIVEDISSEFDEVWLVEDNDGVLKEIVRYKY